VITNAPPCCQRQRVSRLILDLRHDAWRHFFYSLEIRSPKPLSQPILRLGDDPSLRIFPPCKVIYPALNAVWPSDERVELRTVLRFHGREDWALHASSPQHRFLSMGRRIFTQKRRGVAPKCDSEDSNDGGDGRKYDCCEHIGAPNARVLQ
jgi:hypothetical protein